MTFLEAFAIPFFYSPLLQSQQRPKPTKMWIWYRADQEPSEEHDGARGYWTDYTP